MSTKRELTVKKLAKRFGKDPARIRQISIDYKIGKLIEGRVRVFSDHEATRIERIIAETGRTSKNSKNVAHAG